MVAKDFGRRFACFGFDDGYRDNRDHALPVMREFAAPLARQSGWEHSDNQDGHFGGRGERMIVAARR